MTGADPGSESGPHAPARAGAVATAIDGIRGLIRSRQLLPGEPVRQQDMAERLGVSRVPVREALGALETEGIVRHSPNQGYFVAKFSASELEQIYEMRRLLEQTLLRAIVWPPDDRLAEIAALNEELSRAADVGDVARVAVFNRRFHEEIFDLSPLRTIHREVRRLWEMSDSYRALYLSGSAARARVADEHRAMLDALARRDLDGLLTCVDAHRLSAQREVSAMLGGIPPDAATQP